MEIRLFLEEKENEYLSDYATKSCNSLGRIIPVTCVPAFSAIGTE